MAITPAIPSGSVLDPIGLATQIADLRRSISQLDATRTVIGSGTITGAKIAASTITASNIMAGTITGDRIAAGTIIAGNIAAGSIQTTHLAAQAVTAEKIQAGTITTLEIAAGTIQAGDIQAGTITGDRIAASTITGDRIAASTITSDKISVSSLSSLSSNMGSITAGTIQGATIQTAGSGSRVVMDSAGIKGYALDGTTVNFKFDTGTGIATVTGIVIAQSGSSVVASALPPIGGGNLIPDSSFESTAPATDRWSLTLVTITKSTAQARYGAKSLQVTRSSGTDPYAVHQVNGATLNTVKGKAVVVTAWVYVPAATSGLVGGGIDRSVLIYDGSAAVETTITNVPRDTWTRITLKMTVSASAGSFEVRLYNPFNTGVVYYDGIQLELGEVATAYAPQPDEILPETVGTTELQALAVTAAKIAANTITASQIAAGTITATQIAAGGITSSVIAAGAITAQKLSLKFESANQLKNARFSYYTQVGGDPGVVQTDSPGYWQHYDNGGTGTHTWSKVAGGGPNGENSWKLVSSAATAAKGFMTGIVYPFFANTTYVISWWWKGNQQPDVTANTPLDVLNEWIENPATSASVWQRYAKRVRSSSGGPRDINGGTTPPLGYDWVFIYSNTPTYTAEIANVQKEQGEYPTPFAPSADELLPYSVGNTVLAPDSVTTQKILANTIQGGDIAASTITGTNIAGTTITGTHIAASTITSSHINVATLSAITADAGLITAGTFRGPIFETSATNPKLRMDATDGIYVADASGNKAVRITAAAGLDLLPGTTSTPPNERQIRWVNAGSGLVVSQLRSYEASSVSYHEIDANSFGGQWARLSVFASDGPLGEVRVDLPDGQTTVMARNQVSSFMQLTSAAKRKINFGTSNVTFSSSSVSADLAVAHGLGATPTIVMVSSLGDAPWAIAFAHSYGSTNFTIRARTVDGTTPNGSFPFRWIAIL